MTNLKKFEKIQEKEAMKEISKARIESLAKVLHESGREAVLTNKVVKKDGTPVGQIKFIEWDQLNEDAKEGRRIQAGYLLERFIIKKKKNIKKIKV